MFARVLAAVAAACGLVLGAIAVVVVPVVALAGMGFGAFIGAAAWLKARETAATAPTPAGGSPAQPGHRVGLLAGTAATAGWLVLTGVVLVLGPTPTVSILALLVTVPPAWLWVRLFQRRCRAEEDHAARSHEELVCAAPLVPQELSTQELCLAWRRSYIALLDLPAGYARDEVVRVRKDLLDELERRDPAGFARWLETGARAGSDPGRYLATRRASPEPPPPCNTNAVP